MNRIISLILLLIITACLLEDDSPKLFDKEKTTFIADWNLKTNLQDYYWRQGALFVDGRIYKNRDSIQAYFMQQPKVNGFETIVVVQHDSANYFDIGYYKLEDSLKQQLAYVIAWRKEGNRWLKELEVLSPVKITQRVVLDTIDKTRQYWEYLSNKHVYPILVQQLYSDSGFYLNDGYIYKGINPITEKYAYMGKENWHIRLATIQTLQVNDRLFYDIGQYMSNGKGHYLILWQLEKDGYWRVLLDFNF